MKSLPVGKLPPHMLAALLESLPVTDPAILLGPGIGLDCAVIQVGALALVLKSDPITFTADQIGWYAVHVNANDVSTTGARPRWFMATVLLPERESDEARVGSIFAQMGSACRSLGVSLIGGHTEITQGLSRPIVCGTMIGSTDPERLITPQGAKPGDCLLLTKGIPIEATSILAREMRNALVDLPGDIIARAAGYLHEPGISVVPEALAAAQAGGVTAMHDPTEGGLATGLWELATAAGVGLQVDADAIFIPLEAAQICQALHINPLHAIASGALLLTVAPGAVEQVIRSIDDLGVRVFEIGRVTEGDGVAMRTNDGIAPLQPPTRDALAALFEASSRPPWSPRPDDVA